MRLVYYTITIYAVVFNTNLYSETAIIPFKISNPSADFPKELGREYAKLLSVACTIRKGIDLYSPRQLNIDLKDLSLNPERLITEDDLIMLGKGIKVDNIVLGSLSRLKGYFISDSILYSIRSKRIVSKSHIKSDNIFRLAEKDMGDLFFRSPNRISEQSLNSVDSTLLIDLSYSMLRDWNSVKDGIVGFCKAISDNWSIDTRVNIIPISDSYPIKRDLLSQNSHQKIMEALSRLKPRGQNTAKIFQKALSYSVKNIQWRKDVDKLLIIICNSYEREGHFLEKFIIQAKRKGIKVYTISLGLLDRNSEEELRQLSVIGRGIHRAITYHQRLYREKGEAVDIFIEAGRLFHSVIYNKMWREGLFGSNKKERHLEIPMTYLNELFYDEKEHQINPYNISNYYPLLTKSKIINSDQLENNIEYLMQRIGGLKIPRQEVDKTLGKAMLTDGRISIWIKIRRQSDLEFFKECHSQKSLFSLGVVIQENTNEPYGIDFNPDNYITNLSREYIPDMMRTNMRRIIKQSDHHMSTGLLNPPIWFIDVRVDRLERCKMIYDIREK